jgi:EmrB/QacA subfamily drug resistance transporter
MLFVTHSGCRMRFPKINDNTYKWWAFVALSLGVFVSVADAGSVVVALPTISQDFGTDLPTIQWVVTAYALTISALLLPMGRLSDIVGRKLLYVAGTSIFMTGALLAVFSDNVVLLVLPRILMGIGAAMTQGTSMAILITAFPAHERGRALGLQMGVVGIGAVAGPMLGGFIVSAFGWRGVFVVTAVLASTAAVLAQRILRGHDSRQHNRAGSFDWLGAGLSSGFLALFLLVMTNGPQIGWGSPPMILAGTGVAILIALFVAWELKTSTPMFDLRMFKRKLFSLGVSTSFISFVGMSSVRFLMPFYFQFVLGFSPSRIGLLLVPSSLAMVVAGPLGGRLSDRFGWRIFNVGGLMLSACGLFLLSRITTDTSVGLVVATMVMQTIGVGIFNAPNANSILSTVHRDNYGSVSAFLNVVRNSANVTSIAIATAIVTGVMAAKGFPPTLEAVSDTHGRGVLGAFASGLRVVYLAFAFVVVVGAILSFLKGERGTGKPFDR